MYYDFSWQDAPLSSKSSPFVAGEVTIVYLRILMIHGTFYLLFWTLDTGALYLLTVLLLPSFVAD